MKNLTYKQRTMLDYIRDYTKTNGKSPSQQEISGATGIRQSNVGKYLSLIQDKGYLEWIPFEPRGIRLIK